MQSTPKSVSDLPGFQNQKFGSLSLLQRLKVAFLGLSLFAIVAVHLSDLPITIQTAGHAISNLIGQEHRWWMFAADPPGPSFRLSARLVAPDGEVRRWEIDRQRPGGDLAYYHWFKWAEVAVTNPEQANLDGLAEWLLSQTDMTVSELVITGELTSWDAPDDSNPRYRELTLLRVNEP
jgi:hypothetical protein